MSAVSTRTGHIRLTGFKSKQLHVAIEVVEGGTDIAMPVSTFANHLVIADKAGTVLEDVVGVIQTGTTNVVLFTITRLTTDNVDTHDLEYVVVGGVHGVSGDTLAAGEIRVKNSLKVYT